MWNPQEKGIRKARVIAMTPVRAPIGADTVRAGAGALSFIKGSQHKLVTSADHGTVEPYAIVVTCLAACNDVKPEELSGLRTAELPRPHGLASNPIAVHIGCERRLESSAVSGPQHVTRTLAIAATEMGTLSVTVEPGWERILWDHQ